MKKKLLALLMATVLVIGLVACGGNNSGANQGADEAEATDESERTKFVVGFEAGFEPWGYLGDDGEYTGFDIDLAKEVAARNGWEFVATPIDWDTKNLELDSGTIDCIWNGFTITGREDEYTWTEPYIDSDIICLVKEDSDIETLDDLAGKNVCVQKESSGYYALEEERTDLRDSFALLETIDNTNVLFMNLESGADDAVIVDALAAYSYMKAHDGYRVLDEPVVIEQCAVGFKKGNTALRDVVQETMMDMLEDGTFMEIVDKYSEQGVVPEIIPLGK